MKKLIAAGFPIFLISVFLLFSFFGFAGFAWSLDKQDPWQFMLFYSCVCAGFAYWWFNRSLLSWPTILIIAILFRGLFLFDSNCRLSDDIYRYLWDAEQVAYGQNPYEYTPTEWLAQPHESQLPQQDSLYSVLNSKDNYSIYAPVCQLMWSNSVWWAEHAGFGNTIQSRIFFLKVFYLLIEIITMLLIVRILIKRGQAAQLAGIYALNPLVIVEFMGNLHPDVFVILFLSVSVLLVTSNRLMTAAIPFGFAIATKILPIIFLPFLIRKWGWKKAILFSLIALGVGALLFLPFISHKLTENIAANLELYYVRLEFNTSIVYLVRNGYTYFTGSTETALIGPMLAVLSGIIILYYASRKYSEDKGMIYFMITGLAFYSLLSSTVHPWHLTLPLFFAVFSTVRWPLFASLFVMLSYLLYSQGMENKWVLITEYGLIIVSYVIDRLLKAKR